MDGSFQPSCFSFRGFVVLCYCACWLTVTLSWHRAIVIVISNAYAFFPAMTSPNVKCKKDQLLLWVLAIIVLFKVQMTPAKTFCTQQVHFCSLCLHPGKIPVRNQIKDLLTKPHKVLQCKTCNYTTFKQHVNTWCNNILLI